MREILFRGRADNKKWVYGLLAVGKNFDWASILPIETIDDAPPMFAEIEVEVETVGQYTGLKDKNGTKIFEGDILLVGGTQKVVVSFKDGQFIISHYAINLLRDRTLESEVIGNIYDNRKLLIGGAK